MVSMIAGREPWGHLSAIGKVQVPIHGARSKGLCNQRTSSNDNARLQAVEHGKEDCVAARVRGQGIYIVFPI